MVIFKNVSKVFEDTGDVALDNVSFCVPRGDFVFLVGATGAGKTTISRLILKDELTDGGEIFVSGKNLDDLKRRDIPYLRREIGVVFQDYKLLGTKTVFENVAFAMEISGVPARNIKHMVPQILSLVGLEKKAGCMPNQLSGGERQRVAMARAMANNPPLLIADEPTGNLDPDTSLEIMRLFERFNALGTTVMIATHDKVIVDRMKKRVIELRNGKVIRDEKKGGYSNV